MVDQLLSHELEVNKTFLARAMSWVALKNAKEAADLEGASEEVIEHVVLHPHGPSSLEQIVVRAVMNELNALYEFAIQNAWRALFKESFLPSNELVFSAARGTIEQALAKLGLDVRDSAARRENAHHDVAQHHLAAVDPGPCVGPELVAVGAVRVGKDVNRPGGLCLAVADPMGGFSLLPHRCGYRPADRLVQRLACEVLPVGVEHGAGDDVFAVRGRREGHWLAAGVSGPRR